jgi:hypothetical protein
MVAVVWITESTWEACIEQARSAIAAKEAQALLSTAQASLSRPATLQALRGHPEREAGRATLSR